MTRRICAVLGGGGQARPGARLEGVEHQRDETRQGPGGIPPGRGGDGAVADEHEQQVFADHVGAQAARRLGPVDQPDHGAVGPFADGLELLARGQGDEQQVGQAAVTRLHGADPPHEPGEPGPRVRLGQRPLGSHGVRRDLVDERRGDELITGREPPVQGPDPHPGAARDLLQRRVQTDLGEHLAGRAQHGLAVARRVGPQGTAARLSRASDLVFYAPVSHVAISSAVPGRPHGVPLPDPAPRPQHPGLA